MAAAEVIVLFHTNCLLFSVIQKLSAQRADHHLLLALRSIFKPVLSATVWDEALQFHLGFTS